jgi:hypothetical protein
MVDLDIFYDKGLQHKVGGVNEKQEKNKTFGIYKN